MRAIERPGRRRRCGAPRARRPPRPGGGRPGRLRPSTWTRMKPADADHLDDEQVAHRAEERPSDDARSPSATRIPVTRSRACATHLRRLGEDQRGHAGLVGDVPAEEPGLDRLAADAAERGDHVDGLPRAPRRQEPWERRPVGDERVPPAERVQDHADAVDEADEGELPPCDPGQGSVRDSRPKWRTRRTRASRPPARGGSAGCAFCTGQRARSVPRAGSGLVALEGESW